jgi:hypothetical protein
MERSHVSLEKWIQATYLWIDTPPEFRRLGGQLSSVRLALEIGVTQKTSLYMIDRISASRIGRFRRDQNDFLFKVAPALALNKTGVPRP